MNPIDIEFVVNGQNYTAKLIIIGDGPTLYEITDISPAGYLPASPYIFTPNKEKMMLETSQSVTTQDHDFGGPIISAIFKKCKELNMPVFT